MHGLRYPLTWLLALVCILCSASALANKRDYARGVEAAGSGDWDRVEELMANALADDAEPKDRALMYGTYRRPYIPQYYLALAAMNRKDCPAALRYLNDARLSALLGTGGRAAAEATAIAEIRKRCATPLTTEQPPREDPPPVAKLSSAQEASVRNALQQLQLASEAAKSKVPLQNLSAALTQAAQAQAALENAALSADASALQRALQLTGTATSELQRLSAAQAQVQKQPKDPAPVSNREQPTPAPAPAATGLRNALSAFLSGDYQAVQRASTSGMEARSAAHTLLLRAAARYSLFLLGGEREAPLQTQAQADVREARRLLPTIRPTPAYFSPRFVRFFEQTR